MAELAALPRHEWKTVRIERSGRYRAPEIHDQLIKIKDIEGTRPPARRAQHRPRPTNAADHQRHQRTTKQLFARYAERMGIENELDAYIPGFHLDALSSGLPLNVDLDTTLTVIAGNLYRLLARRLPRYEHATPDRLWRHFLDSTGTLHLTDDALIRRPPPPHLPPRPHRRRPRRPDHPDPLARRPPTPLPLPTPLKPQEVFFTENRG